MRLQVEQSESDQVMGARIDRRGAAVIEIVERDCQSVLAVTNRLIALESRPDPNRSVRQAEIDENLFTNEVLIRAPGDKRDHIVQNAETEIGVLVGLAWGGHQVGIAQDGFIHGGRPVGLVGIEELVMKRQTRGVIGYAANRGLR